MKAKAGDKIIITDPDEKSAQKLVKEGQTGKVVWESDLGCFATNPLWKGGRVGFFNEEFEVLKGGSHD